MSVKLSSELRQALTRNRWSLPRALLPQLPHTRGFLSFEADRGVQGLMLIDPDMDPPVRIASYDHRAMDESYLSSRLDEAIAYRKGLAAQDRLALGQEAAWRMVNETGDGLPGLAVDVYARQALVHLYSGIWRSWMPRITNTLLQSGLVDGVYLTERKRGQSRQSGAFVTGQRAEHDQVIAVEHGLKYIIRLAEGPATGLYLDQRENRRYLSSLTAEGSFLNTFSYTCSFSVAAACQGSATLNVDLSKASLQRGRENFALNGIPSDNQRFLADDVFSVLPRLIRRGERFHTVLLDPPTFARFKKRTFSTERNYADLVALAAPLVEAGGHLVAFANTHRMSDEAWTEQVYKGVGAGRARFSPLTRPGQAPDFRFRDDDPGGHYLKGLILKADGSSG